MTRVRAQSPAARIKLNPRLFDRDGAMGAKFSLTNNFKGLSDGKKDDDDNTGQLESLIKGLRQDE